MAEVRRPLESGALLAELRRDGEPPDLDGADQAQVVQTLSARVRALVDAGRIRPQVATVLRTVRRHAAEARGRVCFEGVGTVQNIGNGVATLSGLLQAQIDEVVTFPTRMRGLVLNLGRRHVDVILLGSDKGIQGGDLVLGTDKRLRVPVGTQLLGRVVDALGQPLDESGPIDAIESHPLEQKAPGIIARQPVDEPLHTGLKVVDALVPIGRVQRELILGDRQTGKTTVAVDTILNQADSDAKCIYVAVN